jgi:Outer membrane protein beta-barrel domain
MKYKQIGKLFFTAVLLMVLSVIPVQANAAKGFYLGTGLGLALPNQSGDVIDEVDPESGISSELIHLGYNFSDTWGLGFQWGSAAGLCDDQFGDDSTWGQGYMDLSGRYTFDNGQDDNTFIPYLEAGYGTYVYLVDGDDAELVSDGTIGYRLAVGGQYYLSNWYIAPELSYHFVNYDGEAEIDIDNGFDGDIDFEEDADMLMFLIKFGYHWRK